MKEDTYYVTNKEMIVQMEKYKSSGVISDDLGKMFMGIANNYSNKSNFAGYTWRRDMVSEAVYTCIRYMHNFDLEKSKNPFAYFTQICYHSFLNFIKKQKKHSNIKDTCFNHSYVLSETDEYMRKAINYELLK